MAIGNLFGKRAKEWGAMPWAPDGEIDLLEALVRAMRSYGEFREIREWVQLQAAPEAERVLAVLTCFERARMIGPEGHPLRWDNYYRVATALLRKRLPLGPVERVAVLRGLVGHADRSAQWGQPSLGADYGDPTKVVLRALECRGDLEALPEERDLLEQVRALLVAGGNAEAKRCLPRVDALLGRSVEGPFAHPDRWGAAMQSAVEALPAAERAAAEDAVRLALATASTRPSLKLLDKAGALASEHGQATLGAAVAAALRGALLGVNADSEQVDPISGDALRGLCWVASVLEPDDALAAAVGDWLVTGWRKIPGRGPASRKAATAAAWALARMGDPGAAQLGRARALVKQAQALASVDAAIDEAAERLGIAREEFEERVVPTYGLQAPARKQVALGEFTATLAYAAGRTGIEIAGPDGKVRKSVPAAVRRDFAEELKALRALAKDVTTMVGAQRLRLERLLTEDRSWEPKLWQERYLDHPLVSVVARGMIWEVERDGERTGFLPDASGLRDVEGGPVSFVEGDRVRLWHPATVPTVEVEQWRRRVEDLGVVQPFKQAHREIYLLTPAEERTDTYSNRFAGHIIRQHQLAALARARGWTYALQGAWDSPDEQAVLDLPQHGLTARFWVDRPWGDDEDWNDTGVFNHVLTDQVRFQTGHETLRLADVPVRVLSEVLRDVDLFVGVASIGNDPEWADRGAGRDTRWGDYWRSYSFGDLGAAAEVRRDLLGRLVPKLAIRDVATLEERFLVVRGSLRTYKIHLGSGNILMTPNDQYLCIVPSRKDEEPTGVMLPFEGDRLLSIILSKALLLAADEKITDPSITSQLRR